MSVYLLQKKNKEEKTWNLLDFWSDPESDSENVNGHFIWTLLMN